MNNYVNFIKYFKQNSFSGWSWWRRRGRANASNLCRGISLFSERQKANILWQIGMANLSAEQTVEWLYRMEYNAF